MTFSILKKECLHPESEDFITAIQDKVIKTNVKKHIQNSYLERHNNVSSHQKIATNCKILDKITPYYKYEPQSVPENNNCNCNNVLY